MTPRRKLIVVANRAPVTYARDNEGNRVAKRGAGGLVTGLSGLLGPHDVTWIASALSEEDRAVAAEGGAEAGTETTRDGSRYRLRLLAHDPAAYDHYYNTIANPLLWFAQHLLWGLATQPSWDAGLQEAWDEGYAAVNASFADAVVTELAREPEAAVFFHDYHLYLAPGLVRERAPDATLAHFVHIPWPQPDGWRVLPAAIRRAVHEGLLAADVVGFHADRWRVNFLRSCAELTGAEVDLDRSEARLGARWTAVRARPISVDVREFAELAESDAVLAAEQTLVERRPELLVLRVDRTDPSKNVVRGIRAFELLLETHPELHGRIAMHALLDPSRQDIPEYVEYLRAIEAAAQTVNERFGRPGWRPLELRVEDDFAGSVAAYKQFDALLVNAIFDGLNLIAKEAPLVNTRDGVLILSENAGAHEELGEWALTVNPFDLAGQAEALHRALTMPAPERRARLEGIRRHVREHDIEAWTAAELADLDEARARRP
jgi:trehalose 6-phosphate synthase